MRNVPPHVDKALRRKAQEGRKSLNEALRDALIREAEGTNLPGRVHTDLDALAGSWVDVPGFDDAIRAQDRDVDSAKGRPEAVERLRRGDAGSRREQSLGSRRLPSRNPVRS